MHFSTGIFTENFQAEFIKSHEESTPTQRSYKLLPSHIDDPEVRNNPVVFKAINETRKVINAIIDRYGSPAEIVIEVASELGKSAQMRFEDQKRIKQNESDNDRIKKAISELLSIDETKVSGAMIERYKLFDEQEGKCVYSGKPLGEKKDVIKNSNKEYEIDHIVPYSLILDNTLNNKALVFTVENQCKGQRTPLMYLSGEREKKYTEFISHMYSRKEAPISKKKLEYYKLETIYDEKAREILEAWKSRNINDTRYITKYIAGMINRYLEFTGDKAQHVFTVKGSVTHKFRLEWFRDSRWGDEEKYRTSYLNHALDALIAANLTKAYIEIGSDSLRLIAMYKQARGKITADYTAYLESCIDKMKKYYGFSEEYTRSLLTHTGRVPSYLPRLAAEVAVRFDSETEEEFNEGIEKIYGNETPFMYPLQMPVTSHKQNKKFRGCIADSNPVKVVEIDGEKYKIKRVAIKALTKKQFEKIYTEDISLKEQLEKILDGKKDSYTVEEYLKENELDSFVTTGGIRVRKVSVKEGKISNYYRKEIGDGNYTNLGMPKYYCIEIYEDKDGKTQTSGVRFVDIVNKNGKLMRKIESKPENYGKHIMYIMRNDYLKIYNKKNNLKFEGLYRSVFNINQSLLRMISNNYSIEKVVNIAMSDRIEKYDVSVLGKIGGMVKCSEPLQFTEEKKSL